MYGQKNIIFLLSNKGKRKKEKGAKLKLTKTAEGKEILQMSRKEWRELGEKEGWMKEAKAKKKEDKKETKKDVNPRGQKRPKDGRGKGKGMPGGQRGGKMDKPCPTGEGPGFGQGGGRGKGKNR